MSLSSPEALYHSIPQAPVPSNPVIIGNIELDNDEPPAIANVSVDARIRWIHFILGELRIVSVLIVIFTNL